MDSCINVIRKPTPVAEISGCELFSGKKSVRGWQRGSRGLCSVYRSGESAAGGGTEDKLRVAFAEVRQDDSLKPPLGRTFSGQPPNRGFLSAITDFAAVTLNHHGSKSVSPLAARIFSLQREGTSIVRSEPEP
jgi:hypothetical protein